VRLTGLGASVLAHPQIAGKALIPRPGEERQLDPVRLLLLDLPGAAMEPVAPAVQAVGPLVGVQRPALAFPLKAGAADAVGKAPRLSRHRQGEGGEGGPVCETAQPQSLLVFQLEFHHGLRFPVVIPSPPAGVASAGQGRHPLSGVRYSLPAPALARQT